MVNPKKITVNLFLISVALMFFGALMKILHLQWCDEILLLSIIVYIIFVFYCLSEIWASKKIQMTEKFIWLIFLFLMPIVTGLIYILSQRKKII